MSSIGTKLASKEKVEEDRFMREQEIVFINKKRMEAKTKLFKQQLEEYERTVTPAMIEVAVLLKKTGDHVSYAGLEALAKSKLGKE
jgi:hypothetical protein